MAHVVPRAAALFLALVALSACDSGPVDAPGSSLAADQVEALRGDAVALAFRYQLAVERDSDTVALPEALVGDLHRALLRVRESRRGDLVDGIRARPDYLPHDVLIAPAVSAAWTEAWRRGETATGYAPVDSLVRQYGLTLADYYEYPTVKRALLRTAAPVNTVALARTFERVPGLDSAGPNGLGGDGDDIEATRRSGGWRFDFSRGSGDCPSGCIQRTYWTFQTAGDDVEYLGTRER